MTVSALDDATYHRVRIRLVLRSRLVAKQFSDGMRARFRDAHAIHLRTSRGESRKQTLDTDHRLDPVTMAGRRPRSALRMNCCLDDVFSTLRDRPALFVTPGGNWGDELIYRGALALAERHSIKVTSVTHEQFIEQSFDPLCPVYLHGGGGLNPWTSGRAATGLYHALDHFHGPVIQGPQTITEDPGFVAGLAAALARRPRRTNLVFFARESRSHEIVTAAFAALGIRCYLDHDTAFHNRPHQLLKYVPVRERYRLFALREDNERTHREDAVHADLASIDGGPSKEIRLDPAIYARNFKHWIRIHAASRQIVTNRTHSAIIGAILGVPTTMFASSSHKNHSIWAYSLASRGVAWVDAEDHDATAPDRAVSSGEPTAIGRDRPVSFADRLKRAMNRMTPLLNLPKLRARFEARARRFATRIANTQRGVPWR